MKDNNQRQLLIGGVALVKGRVRHAGQAMVKVSDGLEPILASIAYTEGAPFKTVSLILRFGLQTNLEPEYSRIDRKHNELHVAVELDMADLTACNRGQLEQLFLTATLSVLTDVGKRYSLPYEKLNAKVAEKATI